MLGLCCQFLIEKTKRSGQKVFVNGMEEKSLQLGRFKSGRYTDEYIKNIYVNNTKNLANMLPIIHQSGIHHFRISSSLFPLADQVDRLLWDNDDVKSHLTRAGDFIAANNMRITTHPGQFCVLSSDSDSVIAKSIVDLDIHAWMFDSMNLAKNSKYAINIHGGKKDRSGRLIETIKSLSENVRSRLTVENDEFSYSLRSLLSVHEATGVSLVFDSHHHRLFDDNLSMDDAFDLACQTWEDGIKPLQHISNSIIGMENGTITYRRKHSDMIRYVPKRQLIALKENAVDIEVEAKMKNIAITNMVKDFSINLS